MKETPILFNGEMVRAILEGRKTQTRRVIKLDRVGYLTTRRERHALYQAPLRDGIGPVWPKHDDNKIVGEEPLPQGHWGCPYGQPGDRLWVKETFRYFDANVECACYDACKCATHHGKPIYRADGDHDAKWKPSIFCTRKASRITLEIISLRVERLQNISEEDAKAEGIINGGCMNCGEPEPCKCAIPMPCKSDSFIRLWKSVYGEESWTSNPWVWVIEFKKQ